MGPSACRRSSIFAGNALDHHWRGFGRRVQDFVILELHAPRWQSRWDRWRARRSVTLGGFVALLTVLLIMIILLAVVALVVVNALAGSPWGTFNCGHHADRRVHGPVSALLEARQSARMLADRFPAGDGGNRRQTVGTQSAAGRRSSLLRRSLWRSPSSFTDFWPAPCQCGCFCSRRAIILSTFVKLGVIFLWPWASSLCPELELLALRASPIATAPSSPAKFSFCFITIACGAISDFTRSSLRGPRRNDRQRVRTPGL